MASGNAGRDEGIFNRLNAALLFFPDWFAVLVYWKCPEEEMKWDQHDGQNETREQEGVKKIYGTSVSSTLKGIQYRLHMLSLARPPHRGWVFR
jgi:hypothetical protein